ncbi:hypothetical protein F2Q70_00022033 [Brassica cretica]|uniref:Uncharacterized protein n=2 Tax=Brassica cretica TaxID=69181 RepID=A0A8S9HIB5_BRACR|nr:hypothetical protein F2Q70_00022033 [Brassica cretica]KAF2556974.1 hypothetical protein F2Q68_00015823 [Brassica cretica]KAF3610243.1 hypothetical protein DY000_02048381 [Brassica cretica]
MTGNCPHFDTGQREDGNDDPWGSGGWELYVAETGEPENDLKNKIEEVETDQKESYHCSFQRMRILKPLPLRFMRILLN